MCKTKIGLERRRCAVTVLPTDEEVLCNHNVRISSKMSHVQRKSTICSTSSAPPAIKHDVPYSRLIPRTGNKLSWFSYNQSRANELSLCPLKLKGDARSPSESAVSSERRGFREQSVTYFDDDVASVRSISSPVTESVWLSPTVEEGSSILEEDFGGDEIGEDDVFLQHDGKIFYPRKGCCETSLDWKGWLCMNI